MRMISQYDIKIMQTELTENYNVQKLTACCRREHPSRKYVPMAWTEVPRLQHCHKACNIQSTIHSR